MRVSWPWRFVVCLAAGLALVGFGLVVSARTGSDGFGIALGTVGAWLILRGFLPRYR